jgi:hypothetical protein
VWILVGSKGELPSVIHSASQSGRRLARARELFKRVKRAYHLTTSPPNPLTLIAHPPYPHPPYTHQQRSVNVTVGPHEKRMLITGLHTVADIYCFDCEVRAALCVYRHICSRSLARSRLRCLRSVRPANRFTFLWGPTQCNVSPPSRPPDTDAAGVEVRGGVRGEPEIQGTSMSNRASQQGRGMEWIDRFIGGWVGAN